MMSSKGQLSESSAQVMDHSMHNMNSHEQADELAAVDDCCNQEEHCSMGSCYSLALSQLISDSSFIKSSTLAAQAISLAVSRIPTSLYRPPILA
ncbi:hypothetical protein ACUR5C_08165 [Aliikangiella sp. IMCC44653]